MQPVLVKTKVDPCDINLSIWREKCGFGVKVSLRLMLRVRAGEEVCRKLETQACLFVCPLSTLGENQEQLMKFPFKLLKEMLFVGKLLAFRHILLK